MHFCRALFLALLVCACLPLAAQDARSSDPKQRVRYAKDLSKQGSEAIPRLQAMLKDPVTEVRVETVKALIEVGTQYSLDPLVQATRDNDPEVQIRATDGLVNFYMPGYVKTGLSASLRRAGTALRSKFTDTNDQVIDPYIQVRPEVIDALGKLARSGSSMESRANAARAVGILRGKAAVPDLIEALHSKDDQVLYESLTALQKIRDPSAAPRIAFLLRDLNDRVQVAAIETTGLLRNREALPDLRRVLATARNDRIRRAALTAIAMIPDPADRPLYLRHMNDKNEDLRAAAAEGLARLNNPADLPVIEKSFNEERKMPARLADAFALVTLGKTNVADFSPLQYLINTLNSSAWKGVARAYLVELCRNAAVRKPVQEATRRATKDEKIELAQILAVSGDKETVPYLEALSRDSDVEVAQAGINAARTLKSRLP